VLELGVDALRVIDVENGVTHRVQFHALVFAGQDAGGPLPRGERLHLAAAAGRQQNYEARQILRVRAEAVEDPGTHARPAGYDGAGVHHAMRGVVIDLLGPHGADDADVVRHAADVGEQAYHLLSRFAELLELVLRAEAFQLFALQLCDLLALGERFGHALAVHLRQLRLVVERLQVRGAAGLVEKDDALRLGGEVQRIYYAVRRSGGGGGCKQFRVEQRVQRNYAEAGNALAQERPTVDVRDPVVPVHDSVLVIVSCRFRMARA